MANKNAIIDALGEAKEKLILNKYNDAMMLMAQITIDVIEHLTDEALVVSKGYEEDLKTIKSLGLIADDTEHNFETLIISGVQAHNGVDIPKEHAEKALEVLTNELDILFKKNEDKVSESKIYEYEEDENPYPGDFTKDMTSSGETPAFLQKGVEDEDFRKKERLRKQMMSNEYNSKSKRKIMRLFAVIIPIVLILLLAFGVRAIVVSVGRPKVKKNKKPIETVQIVETSILETIETEETEPPLPPEAGYYDVTGDLVKIRDAATTEGSKVKGTVNKGDKVYVKSFYNSDWAVTIFDGNEAYIARRYIKKDETLSPVFEESAAVVEE